MEIPFKTVMSSLKKGGKACYRAIPLTQGSVDMKILTEHAAARVGMDPAVMRFNGELLFAQISKELLDGKRVEIENLFSGGIAVEGVFEAANSPWDKTKNRLVPYFYAKGDMKNAFAGATGVNVTVGNHCTIKRVLDTSLKTDGVIANIANVTVYISGVNMLVDATAEDEGVWLEDEEGTIVAKATVTASTSTTTDATFTTFPLVKAGAYKIVVGSRGGLGEGFGVSIARKAVEIKNPEDEGGE